MQSQLERRACRLLRESLQEHRRPTRLRVRGRCMEPLIREGDWVEVVAEEPRIGSLVLATSSSGELVCHRVIAATQTGRVLAGDRSLTSEPTALTQILGRIRGIERGNRTITYPATNPAMERLLTGWHRLSIHHRGTASGRARELGRRMLLRLHARGIWAHPRVTPAASG